MTSPSTTERKRRRLTKCEQHEINDLNYFAFFEDCEIRTARGERQYKCAECGLWKWPRSRVGQGSSGGGTP